MTGFYNLDGVFTARYELSLYESGRSLVAGPSSRRPEIDARTVNV